MKKNRSTKCAAQFCVLCARWLLFWWSNFFRHCQHREIWHHWLIESRWPMCILCTFCMFSRYIYMHWERNTHIHGQTSAPYLGLFGFSWAHSLVQRSLACSPISTQTSIFILAIVLYFKSAIIPTHHRFPFDKWLVCVDSIFSIWLNA